MTFFPIVAWKSDDSRKRKNTSYTNCKCGHEASNVGSSSSGSKSGFSLGGNVRNRLTEIYKKNAHKFWVFWEYFEVAQTILMISGYTASVSTPRPWVMYAERSLSAARLISFPFKSETGSIKSNETQHCLNFRMNSSSCSILEISTTMNTESM